MKPPHRSTLPNRFEAGTALLDVHCRVLDASGPFLRQFGIERARDQDFVELLHPSVRRRTRTDFVGILSGRSDRFESEIIGSRPDGGIFPASLLGIAMHGPQGVVTELTAVVVPGADPSPVENPEVSPLDARILEGIAAGRSNTEIAAELQLSLQRVEYRVTAMLRKLQAPSRAALVARAYMAGLLQIGDWPPQALPEKRK